METRTERNVKYLKQDGYEVLHSGTMVLMKDKKSGRYVFVDAAGTKWYAEMMWGR